MITSKRVSWCDERFTGYGGNKAACLFEMYLSGVSFFVMSDHFLIHQSHKYEEEARREEVSDHFPFIGGTPVSVESGLIKCNIEEV